MTAFWVTSRSIRRSSVRAYVVCGAFCAVAAAGAVLAQETVQNPTAATLAGFQTRIDAYMALHDKAAQGLEKPGKNATPAELVDYQRALEARLTPLRTGVKAGNVFTADIQSFIRKFLAQLFSGPQGVNLRGVVMDENPVTVEYHVNSRYPTTVPLSTMPAQVLQVLPKLPEGLEYRFIGRDLILMDVRAQTIVDYVKDAIPA